jgi:hypothetical protein
MYMRLVLLLVTTLLATPVASAQERVSSPNRYVVSSSALLASAQSPTPSTSSTSSAATAPASPAGDTSATGNEPRDLPVSLDRIRRELRKEVRNSLLRRYDIPADFRVHVLEQQKIDDLLSKLDFKSGQGPAPAGGLYGYEQQRRLFNPVDRPLAQPYAAFSPGEFFTIALQSIIGNYLGGKALDALKGANRERAERTARDRVAYEIAAYCATRPDRAEIALCALPYDR